MYLAAYMYLYADAALCLWSLHVNYYRLEKQVRDVVHKAFWDKLREELNQEPPVFSQAMSLIEEVKEVIIADPVVSKLYMSFARVSMNIQIMLLFLYKLIFNSLGIDPSTFFFNFWHGPGSENPFVLVSSISTVMY